MTPPERLTLKSIGADFIRDFTQAEKGLWGTIVQLTTRPRRVLDTFLYENRQHFSRPTRYLIFCLSIAAFLFIAVQWRYGVSLVEYGETVAEDQENYRGFIASFAEGFASGGEGKAISVKALAAYANYALVLLIPAYAFLYFFLFPARGLNYAESLAGAVYLHSHYFLITSVVSLPFLVFSDIEDFALARSWIGIGAGVLLLVSSLRMFLVSRKDLIWIAPKLMLGAVWAAVPLLFLGFFVLATMSIVLPEIPSMSLGLFLSAVPILIILTVLANKLLLAFRTQWPRWYVWVPTLLVVLGFYIMIALSLVSES